MAKTKNKTKKVQQTAKKRLTTNNIIIIICVILVVLGLFLVTYNYNLARRDKLTAQTLGEYKIKIEKISKAIEQKYGQKPELKEYCYHTAEEFSQGVIFCDQELKFTNKVGKNQELIKQLKTIINILKPSSLSPPTAGSDYNLNTNKVITISSQKSASNRVNCSTHLNAYGVDFVGLESGAYNLELYCNGGGFRKPIYPLND